jgi:predicted FMN-binding regulatory protein PaiB
MYVPEHFDEPSVEAIHLLMTDHPFATLIANGKSKLSQNKEHRDRLGAAEALRQRGAGALADEMLP